MIKMFSRKPRVGRAKQALGEIAPQLGRYARDLPPVPSTGALPQRVYEQMERDSMIQTALTIKKLAVLSADFEIVPVSKGAAASRNAAFVKAVFERMEGSPATILQQAMDSFAKGWSVQEQVYRYEAGRIWLQAVRPKNPSNFALETDRFGKPEKLILRLPGEVDQELPLPKFAMHINRAGYGAAQGISDLDAVYPHYQAKQRLLGAWRIHLEKFASPTVIGRFERGLSAQEQAEALSALSQLQDRTAIICPSEFDISTIGGDKSASSSFLDALEYHNREIARAILGQTLTTDEGRRVGSLALGKVHLQVLLLQIQAIRKDLADKVMTEQVIRPLVELNFGPGDIPRFEFKTEPIDSFITGRID